MKAIIVLTFDPPTPEAVTGILDALNPTLVPHFSGEARIAFTDDAEAVLRWLDDEDGELDLRRCHVCGCTTSNCADCIARTGEPCHWVSDDLCSACVITPKTVQ